MSDQPTPMSGHVVLLGQIMDTNRPNRDAVDMVKFQNGDVSTEFSGRFASVAQLPNGKIEHMARATFFLDIKIRTHGCGYALEAGDFVEIEGYLDTEEWPQTQIDYVYNGEGRDRKQVFADAGGKRIPLVTERQVKRRKTIITAVQKVTRLPEQPEWWGGSRSDTAISGVEKIDLSAIPEAGARRKANANNAPATANQTSDV